MGQKLSELRGFMLTMEDEEEALRPPQHKASDEHSDNGNVAEDEHFEAIYSTRNEPGTPGTSSDHLNGNAASDDAHHTDCSASEPQCTCGQAKARAARKRDEPTGSLKRTARAVSLGGSKKSRPKRSKDTAGSGAKKRPHWGLRLNCARLKADADLPDGARDGCVCTGYRCTADPPADLSPLHSPPAIDLARFNPEDFPIEDCDERARLERAREMAVGVEPPPGFTLAPELSLDSLAVFFQTRLGLGLQAGVALSALSHMDTSRVTSIPAFQRMHSQADFIHCLVPDLLQITSCSFYWGMFFSGIIILWVRD